MCVKRSETRRICLRLTTFHLPRESDWKNFSLDCNPHHLHSFLTAVSTTSFVADVQNDLSVVVLKQFCPSCIVKQWTSFVDLKSDVTFSRSEVELVDKETPRRVTANACSTVVYRGIGVGRYWPISPQAERPIRQQICIDWSTVSRLSIAGQ